MVARAASKDLVDLQRLAEEQGWSIEHTGSGHLRWVPPHDGAAVITSLTPSHQRTINMIKHDLKAAGLVVNRVEWKRIKRAASVAVRVYQAMENDILTAMEAAQMDPLFEPGDMPAEVVKMLHPQLKDGLLDLTCHCGRIFVHPYGYTQHRAKCDQVTAMDLEHGTQEVPQAEPVVVAPTDPTPETKEIMPKKELHKCEHCGKTFARYQSLTAHRLSHQTGSCEFCHRQMPLCNVGTHQFSCAKNPDRQKNLKRRKGHCPHCHKMMLASSIALHVRAHCPVARSQEAASRPDIPTAPVDTGESAVPASPATSTSVGTSDDELWALLEIVLDGPIQMNRATFVVISEWMDATRTLLMLKAEQG